MRELNSSSRLIRTFSTSESISLSDNPQAQRLLDDQSLMTAYRPTYVSRRPIGLYLLTSSMNEWCINQHGKTGLTQACIDSPHTHEEVEESVRAYLEKWIPEAGAGLLAGSSVHADMRYVPLAPFPSQALLSLSLMALSLSTFAHFSSFCLAGKWILLGSTPLISRFRLNPFFAPKRTELTIDSSCSTCQA